MTIKQHTIIITSSLLAPQCNNSSIAATESDNTAYINGVHSFSSN